ncbi:MAG: hypothetical protein ACPGSB_08550 [Opitutales bacterium]
MGTRRSGFLKLAPEVAGTVPVPTLLSNFIFAPQVGLPSWSKSRGEATGL